MNSISRNAPCPCGSGKKYKQCCLAADAAQASNDALRQQSARTAIASLMAAAIAAHQSGQLTEARTGYQQILGIDADHFDSLHLLGVIAQQEGDLDSAIALIGKAIAQNSLSPFAFNNRGSALQAKGRLDAARDDFAKAVSLKVDYAEPRSNLGNVYVAQGRYDEALVCYRQAIAINPAIAEFHNNLGIAHHRLRQFDAALAGGLKALALQPQSAEIHNHLGNVYKDLQQLDLALTHYRAAATLNPQHGNAVHFVAVLSGQSTERAPDAYVAKVFDDYADRFDHHLQDVLAYRIPRIAAERLTSLFALPDAALTILDLGCGTGLVGASLARHAHHIVGVDLSANMLQKARDRSLYHRLVQSDLLAMTSNEAGASYDLVVAADVFVYVGRLDGIIADVHRLLRPNGLFAFSVELFGRVGGTDDRAGPEAVNDGYHLQASGRYAHAANYLAQLGERHDFRVIEQSSQTIRSENGLAISGLLVIWQKKS